MALNYLTYLAYDALEPNIDARTMEFTTQSIIMLTQPINAAVYRHRYGRKNN
jgi:hypothetical protein